MSSFPFQPQQSTPQGQEVVALNNQGLAYLFYGMVGQAVVSFRSALKIISELSDGSTSSPQNVFDSIRFQERSLPHDLIAKKNPQALMSNAIMLSTSGFELIQHQEAPTNVPCAPNNNVNSIAAAVLFNLGLAYHLTSVKTGGDLHIERTLKMYRLAAETLHRLGEHVANMNFSDLSLLLAVYNNQAHASLHFLDLSTAEKSLEAVRYLLNLCPSHIVDAEWYQLYRINVVCTNFDFASPAA